MTLDTNWKDKLTSYNGTTIYYDSIGNPTNDGTWTYTWQTGRQLAGISKTGTTVQFKYDHNGLRTQKNVTDGGVTTTTNYTLHGKLITHLTQGSNSLHFFYDAQSRPTKVKYNGTLYTYIHNLQGDIVGILDDGGALVVEYKYDVWGRKLSLTGSLATSLGAINPFRYRGYVFDEETGLYYLRSRYYNPTWSRYVIGDVYYSTSQGILCSNRFCYCANTPAICSDGDGTWFMLLTAAIGAVVGAVVGGVVAATKGEDVLVGTLKGAAIGGAIGLGAGAVAGIALAGSVTASTLAVVTGAETVTALIAGGSIAAGGQFILQNFRNFISNITVLGHYPQYIETAKNVGARYFSYPTSTWNSLTNAQQYRLNMEFLNKAIAQGQTIYLSTNAYAARAGSALATEIQYLISHGYKIINEGWTLIK